MIRHGVVLVPAPFRRDHLGERGDPVGEVRVRMEVTAQIFFLNDQWCLTQRRRLDLPRVLAQRGLHPGQAELLVDLLLGPADDEFLIAEPVKYWRAAPQQSGLTTRRSTWSQEHDRGTRP